MTETAQLPIVQRNHQIVAVGSYPLPEQIVLPPNLTPQPVATAYFLRGPHRVFEGVQVFFPVSEEKAVLAWAQDFPIVVVHTGAAVWHSQHRTYFVQNKSALGSNTQLDHPIPASAPVWGVYGTFLTKGWTYGVNFDYGDLLIAQTTHPLPKSKLSLFILFFKRPIRVWLPVHEAGHRLISVGTYQLPDPIILPAGLHPLPQALVTLVRNSPSTRFDIRVFFPPKEEAAVFQWATSSPVVTANDPHRWQPRDCMFWTRGSGGANDYIFSRVAPSAATVLWNVNGPLPGKARQTFLSVDGAPVATTGELKAASPGRSLFAGFPNEYVGDTDDFGRNSLLKGELRHVSLRVDF